jgi:hypothetical protein
VALAVALFIVLSTGGFAYASSTGTSTTVQPVVSVADNQTGAYLLLIIGGTCGVIVGSYLIGRRHD